jgi:hypothetical protein
MARKIITRSEAKALGLKRYFTGKPCKHGHVSERLVSDWVCTECHSEKRRNWRAANHEKCRERSRKWKRNNPEKCREHGRKWRAANPEKCMEYGRKRGAANPEKYRERERERGRRRNRARRNEQNRQYRAASPEKYREQLRKHQSVYRFMRDILLDMGLIKKEDTPAEKMGLVRAYVKLGLLNRQEIHEWLNTQTLKKA